MLDQNAIHMHVHYLVILYIIYTHILSYRKINNHITLYKQTYNDQ
jgi:hypothetical protein